MKSAILIFSFLVLLSSSAFAEVQWNSVADSGVTGAGVLLGGKAIFTTYSGNVYAYLASTGNPVWVYNAGSNIALEPVAIDAFTLAIATTDGQVTVLNAEDRRVKMQPHNFRIMPYALASGDGKMFIGFNGSIIALSTDDKILWNTTIQGAPGQIGYGDGMLYFTANGNAYAVSAQSGNVQWVVSEGDSFLFRPVETSGTVYMGLGDRFVALNFANGHELWSQQAGGWVQSSPAITEDGVYFGSDDGYLYAVDSAGNLRWKSYSGAPIWSSPAVLGKQIVFGNNAGQFIGLDSANGQKIWSFSGDGRVYSPMVYKDTASFIFGTSSGLVYSVSSSPICSFTSPNDGDAIGDWPADIEGSAYSDSGIGKVELRVENGDWVAASGAEDWYASIDFTGKAPGAYKLECRATDKTGRSETNHYSSITVVKQDSLPAQKLYVSAPSEVRDKDNFTLYVTDSDGNDLHGVTITIGDVKKTDTSPFSIQLGKTGPVEIGASKPGYDPAKAVVVGVGEGNIFVPVIIVIAVAAAGYFFFIRKPKEKSKYSS